MNNFIAFTNAFLSNLFVFVVFGALIVTAILTGIKIRKIKNNKAQLEDAKRD